MKTIFLGVLLAASLATAQNTLGVDLSGEWRMSTDSRPEFAAPDLDDHDWAVVKLRYGNDSPDLGHWSLSH